MNDEKKDFYKVIINFQTNNAKITSITKVQSCNKPNNQIIHKLNYALWINYFKNRAELINYIQYIYCPIIINHKQSIDDILSLLPMED